MQTSRRVFLGSGAALTAQAYQRVRSANERIGLGLIGAGGRGGALFQDVVKADANAAIVAVCDVYKPHLQAMSGRAEKQFGGKVFQSPDYRDLLSRPEIDAVLISAPDFAHARMLEDAVNAGKDAYVEKPFATDFQEARRAWVAAHRTGRVVQVGSQRRSDPYYVAAAKLVQGGALGKVTRVDIQVHLQEPRWRRDYSQVRKEDLDWDRFRMDRWEGPFDARVWREWQLFRHTTNGIPGLWMSHFADLIRWFLGDKYPATAVANGGVFLWNDGRETEDVFQAMLTYPSGVMFTFAMSLTNSSGSRNLWCGSRGTLDLDGRRISGEGSTAPDRITEESKLVPEEVSSHMANFIQCVRRREKPRADVDAGFSHAVAVCMAAEAFKTGRTVRFDSNRIEML